MQLKETLTHVNKQLKSSRERMQSQYNKKLNFFDYKVGAKVWVKKKNHKTGENRKLAPRKTGPWTIRRKCNNGVNYEVVNDSDKKVKIIHHNRLYPYNTPPPRNDLQSDQSDDYCSETTSDESDKDLPRRYPSRIRSRPERDGYVSWDVADEIIRDDEPL